MGTDARYVLGILALLTGCRQHATGVLVTVEGPAIAVDQLQVTAQLDGVAVPSVAIPSTARALSLPVTFFASLPDRDETVRFDVTAYAGGAQVAHAVSDLVAVEPHASPSITVRFADLGDGGADLGPLGPADAGTAQCGNPSVSTYCTGGEIFCDGFEATSGSGSPPFYAWDTQVRANYMGGAAGPDTTVELSSTRSCEGGHALHAVAKGIDQQAFLAKDGLSLPGAFYFQSHLYAPAATATAGRTVLYELSTSDASSYVQIGYDPSSSTLYFYSTSDGTQAVFSAALPADRWFCLGGYLRLDPTDGEVKIWLDGVLIGGTTGIPTLPTGATLSAFGVGIIAADVDDELYVDEVALSATPLSCE